MSCPQLLAHMLEALVAMTKDSAEPHQGEVEAPGAHGSSFCHICVEIAHILGSPIVVSFKAVQELGTRDLWIQMCVCVGDEQMARASCYRP